MCTTCGCGSDDDHRHQKHPYRPRALAKPVAETRRVRLERDLLAANDEQAQANRALRAQRGVLALNLVSSPGAGTTTLLVRPTERLAGRLPAPAIERAKQT